MRLALSLAAATMAVVSHAQSQVSQLWGTSLVSAVSHPSITGNGTGLAQGNLGVVDGGYNVSQISTVHSVTQNRYAGDQQQTSASTYYDVTVHVFWRGTPPSSFYINTITSSSCSASASLSNAGTATPFAATVEASASGSDSTATAKVPYVYSDSRSDSKSSITRASMFFDNVQWIAVGTVSGETLWRTQTPVSFTTATAKADGKAMIYRGNADATSLSVSAIGISYRVATFPYGQ